MDYFDELEKNIIYYLEVNENRNRKRVKTNKFVRKVECWKCGAFFRRVVLTKYHGVLCVKCYDSLYLNLFYPFNTYYRS